MAWRSRRYRNTLKLVLVVAIFLSFLITIYLGNSYLPNSYKLKFRGDDDEGDEETKSHVTTSISVQSKILHRLCVIVPFRERFEELLTFAPFIHQYLNQKAINHDIIVVNQMDQYRFNRASLINVGFEYVTNPHRSNPCDYVVMHDVDLLPVNNNLPYDFPEVQTVTHVAAPGLHPKYNYSSFIGGILVVSSELFRLVNGMSNVYWGWGLEDDEFYVRLKQSNIQIIRPRGITTGQQSTFRHIHSPKQRPRDHAKCYDQYNKTRRRDRITGLKNVNYTLQSLSHIQIEETPVTILNVQLHCDFQLSPWCDCSVNNLKTSYNSHLNNSNLKTSNKKNRLGKIKKSQK